jgi:hypothetical protein
MANLAQNRIDDNTANIPTFHGEPSKDTITLSAFINRINRAKDMLAWTEATAFQYFEGAVRGSALSWLEHWRSDNRDVQHTWTLVKKDFRRNFGDFTEESTFAQDISNVTLASFGGDFNKYYARVVKLVDLHNEYFLNLPIPFQDDHGFDDDQIDQIAVIVHKTLHVVHDRLKKEYFMNGLPKDMIKKIADKPELTKPPQMVEYLRRCETLEKKKSAQQQPQVVQQQLPVAEVYHDCVESLEDEHVEAANFSQNRPNSQGGRGGNTTTRGRGNNNNRGQSTRGGNNQSSGNNQRNNSNNRGNRKTALCFYCRKPNHVQAHCAARIKDNQPCLTPQGKQYWPNSNSAANHSTVNMTTEEQKEQQQFSVFHLEV